MAATSPASRQPGTVNQTLVRPPAEAAPTSPPQASTSWATMVLAPSAVAYAAINAVAKLRARRELRSRGAIAWNRDETTRTMPPSGPPSPTSTGVSL